MGLYSLDGYLPTPSLGPITSSVGFLTSVLFVGSLGSVSFCSPPKSRLLSDLYQVFTRCLRPCQSTFGRLAFTETSLARGSGEDLVSIRPSTFRPMLGTCVDGISVGPLQGRWLRWDHCRRDDPRSEEGTWGGVSSVSGLVQRGDDFWESSRGDSES